MSTYNDMSDSDDDPYVREEISDSPNIQENITVEEEIRLDDLTQKDTINLEGDIEDPLV